jgi:mannosyl-oligosaccharide alpha-1,2-mannosidase
MPSISRLITYSLTAIVFITLLLHLRPLGSSTPSPDALDDDPGKFKWSNRRQHFPVTDYIKLPPPSNPLIPKVQHFFPNPSPEEAATQRQRQAQVKMAMIRTWKAYRGRAFMMDELAPVSGGNKTTYGGWAATLVDSLDTLWIMDMKVEFYEALDAISHIDFASTTMETINLFETTIRYMGGFLGAYDLSGDKRLLHKALELADMIYAAFDTPNRMPILRWDFHAAAAGLVQVAPKDIVLAEIGSLCLEFTRLSQITGQPKWYDAIARITNVFDEQQSKTALPGLWPWKVNGEAADFATGDRFTLGAFADSIYEYLPKMYALLGGNEQYAKMYSGAVETALNHVLYRPMVKDHKSLLLAPSVVQVIDGVQTLQPELEHLECFIGGMFALGGRLLGNESHVGVGSSLTETCVWATKQFPTGLMPEKSRLIPCDAIDKCPWDEEKWHQNVLQHSGVFENMGKDASTLIKDLHLPEGFSAIMDARYHLRPELAESLFVMYRLTGKAIYQEMAWTLFRSIYVHTRTEFAHAAVEDVTNSTAPKLDNMESFW